MEKYFSKVPKPNVNVDPPPPPPPKVNASNVDKASGKRPRVEVDVSDDDIIGDLGMRPPLESYSSQMQDALRRRYLAKGPCQPIGHDFPQITFGKSSRRFNGDWFKSYKWLEYSVSRDRAYCLWCYLFAHTLGTKVNKYGSKTWTEIGFNDWKDATISLRKHEGLPGSFHNGCRVMVNEFQKQQGNIDNLLAFKTVAMEEEYRTRLKTVVNVVQLLLEEGLPFRGHDESESSMHQGHFLGVLRWFCRLNEEANKVMFANAPKNNQLTPSIQKDIIECCAMETRKVIFKEFQNKYFSLLIDEARDCSIKEQQMAIVVRFVSDEGAIMERFLGVVHVRETTAHFLKNSIDAFFAKHGILLARLRGQGYDGASNMRGEFNGLKALILNENKHAHYVHCFAHQLQLVVVSIAKERYVVGNFFDTLSMIVNTIGSSCKRKDSLQHLHHEEVVQKIEKGELETGRGQNQEESLARPGDTRWGSHYKTLLRLFDLWNSIGGLLLSLHENAFERNTRSMVVGLLDKMYTFEFVFVAKFILKLLGYTNTLSQVLQEKDRDIASAIRKIDVTKKRLQKFRDDGWDEMLNDVSTFCEQHKIEVPNMEAIVPSRGKHLVDGAPRTIYHFFYVDIFLKIIDLLLQEFDNHFTEENTKLLQCMMCLDPSKSFAIFNKDKLLELARLYSDDFSSVEVMELDHQLDTYIEYVRSNAEFSKLQDIGALAKKMVEVGYNKHFRLVYRLIELVLVLPVGTATVERCFSAMNNVKTDLRNRMGDEFLSDCLLCFIEKELLSQLKPRQLCNIFRSW